MAGVISRSAYLEAKTPAEDEGKGKKKTVLRRKLWLRTNVSFNLF